MARDFRYNLYWFLTKSIDVVGQLNCFRWLPHDSGDTAGEILGISKLLKALTLCVDDSDKQGQLWFNVINIDTLLLRLNTYVFSHLVKALANMTMPPTNGTQPIGTPVIGQCQKNV